MRLIYAVLGMLAFGLGILGALLPAMPSTCFFILSAYFFGKSSKRLEAWLLSHPHFGPTVVAWREHKAMSRSAKMAAYMGMSIGEAMLLASWPNIWVVGLGTLFIAFSFWYVWSRPVYSANYTIDSAK
jgi:uncharacterized membrane protein YbaN (DUF454 family)